MNEVLCSIFGVVVGVLVLCGLFLGTMAAYFAVRKRRPDSKFSIEILFFLVVFFLTTAVRMFLEWQVNPQSGFWGALSNVLYTFYSTIGSVGFGGLSYARSEGLNAIILTIYYGTSFYMCLIFASLIGARVSYESYSFIRLLFSCKDQDIYVFTALTEESVTLAESINEEGKKKGKSPLIVFGGPSIKAFDRKNALCRRVMANGFCYWTYSSKKAKSIAKTLHLNNANSDFKSLDEKRDFMIFAFDAKDHIPQEEENLETVLNDVKLRNGENDDLHIEYFILTKRKINYQAYQKTIDALKSANKKVGFSVNIWNEAQEVARTTVREILDNGYIERLARDESHPVTVWAIGFGGTGEAITNELFVQTPSLCLMGEHTPGGQEKYYSRPFAVNVFDVKMDEAGEIFRAAHPENYVFLDDPDWNTLVDRSIAASIAAEGLPRPAYGFHKFRDNSNELYKMREAILGETGPDVITISTGNDYRNITYANVISQWIVDDHVKKAQAEVKVNTDDKKKYEKPRIRYLAVTVFNKNNNALFSCFPTEDKKAKGFETANDGRIIRIPDEQGNPYLVILIVNNLEEVYSFRNYEERFRAALMKHSTYNAATGSKNSELVALKMIGNSHNALSTVFQREPIWHGKAVKDRKEWRSLPMSVFDVFAKPFEKAITEIQSEQPNVRTALDAYAQAHPADGSFLYGKSQDENVRMALAKINAFFCSYKKKLEEQCDEYKYFVGASLWDKRSNYSVVAAEPFFRRYFGDRLIETITQYGSSLPVVSYGLAKALFDWKEKANAFEHDRWTRLHFSDGWVYAKKREKGRKQHPCLLSYAELVRSVNSDTRIYDLANVLWAICDSFLFEGIVIKEVKQETDK